MNHRIKMRQKNHTCLRSPSSVDIPVFNEAFRVTGMRQKRVQHKHSADNHETFEDSSKYLPSEPVMRVFSKYNDSASKRIEVGKSAHYQSIDLQRSTFKSGGSIPMLQVN